MVVSLKMWDGKCVHFF